MSSLSIMRFFIQFPIFFRVYDEVCCNEYTTPRRSYSRHRFLSFLLVSHEEEKKTFFDNQRVEHVKGLPMVKLWGLDGFFKALIVVLVARLKMGGDRCSCMNTKHRWIVLRSLKYDCNENNNEIAIKSARVWKKGPQLRWLGFWKKEP